MFGSTWFAVWVVCCATLVAGFPAVTDDNTEFALNWLRSYGYLYTSKADDELSIADVSTAIRRMQAFASLPETGEVDADTLKVMKMPRCGVPDFQQDEDGQLIKRYVIHNGWTKTALTYKFRSYTNDLSQSEIKSTVAAAFKYWSDVSPLTFSLVTGTADIVIDFYTGIHNDGYERRFDGPGGTLAHGFYPGNIPISGDIHYDDAEKFRMHSTNSDDIDFLALSVHEIGHAIGIDHSDIPLTIMEPYYRKLSTVKLHTDDMAAILKLYCQYY